VGITSLDLSRCAGFDLEAMRALNSLPNVTNLRLLDNSGWHPDSLQWLFDRAGPTSMDPRPNSSLLTTVTSLDITGCPQFATASCMALLSRLRNLRRLRFENAPLHVEVTQALLDAIPGITDLNLRGAEGIGEQAVLQMLTALPTLANLDITGSRGVTDRVLLRTVTTMSASLRQLRIAGAAAGGDGDEGAGKLTDYCMQKFRELKVPLEVRDVATRSCCRVVSCCPTMLAVRSS
jgi:hypothetical protein